MKTRITLAIESDLLQKVSRLAAKRGVPVSQLLIEQMQVLVGRPGSYDAAKRRALARLARGYDLGWVSPKHRDELHER